MNINFEKLMCQFQCPALVNAVAVGLRKWRLFFCSTETIKASQCIFCSHNLLTKTLKMAVNTIGPFKGFVVA